MCTNVPIFCLDLARQRISNRFARSSSGSVHPAVCKKIGARIQRRLIGSPSYLFCNFHCVLTFRPGEPPQTLCVRMTWVVHSGMYLFPGQELILSPCHFHLNLARRTFTLDFRTPLLLATVAGLPDMVPLLLLHYPTTSPSTCPRDNSGCGVSWLGKIVCTLYVVSVVGAFDCCDPPENPR